MEIKKKQIGILITLVLCLLTACGGETEEQPPLEDSATLIPNAYFVGSESIVAVQPEAGVSLAELKTTEDGSFVYTYTGFAAANVSVQNYVTTLTGEDMGFSIVDGETFKPAPAPDYTTEEGTISLSKPTENEKITVVRLDWSIAQCIASISIEDAPVVESPQKNNNKNNNSYGLSHAGAADFLKSLSPSVLGLEGDSMEAYNVYIMNGFAYVDGEACLRVKIYSTDADTGTNVFLGTYFMSGNGEHIYLLNEEGLAIEMDQKTA